MWRFVGKRSPALPGGFSTARPLRGESGHILNRSSRPEAGSVLRGGRGFPNGPTGRAPRRFGPATFHVFRVFRTRGPETILIDEALPSAAVAFAGGALSFFFATSREALTQFSLQRLLERRKDPAAREKLEKTLEKSEDMAFTAAILKVLSNLLFVAGLFACAGLGHTATPFWVDALAFGFAAVGLLLVNEVAPRALAQFRPEGILLAFLPVLTRIHAISFPVIRTCNALVRAITRARGVNPEAEEAEGIVEEIREAAEEGEREGVIDDASVDMIDRIIEFRDWTAREVMTPRTDVLALEVSTPIRTAVARAVEWGHSRIPVFAGTLDSVVGLLYVKDLLRYWDKPHAGISLREMVRPATFVPETQRIRNLLPIFQAGKTHFAIVTDEFGGTAGVITIEDVLEEIVGEIQDEYDTTPPAPVKHVSEGVADVDGRVTISAVNEALSLEIPESDDYDTIGGFVASRIGRIPPVGETFTHDALEFKILEADERRVNRIRIARQATKEAVPGRPGG